MFFPLVFNADIKGESASDGKTAESPQHHAVENYTTVLHPTCFIMHFPHATKIKNSSRAYWLKKNNLWQKGKASSTGKICAAFEGNAQRFVYKETIQSSRGYFKAKALGKSHWSFQNKMPNNKIWSHQKHKYIEIKLNTLSIHFSPLYAFIYNTSALQRAPFHTYGGKSPPATSLMNTLKLPYLTT